MKKLTLLALSLSFLSFTAYTQTWTDGSTIGGNASDLVTDPNTDNVGIGNFHGYPVPTEKLSVGGSISLYPGDVPTAARKINAYADNSGLQIHANTSYFDGPAISLFGKSLGGEITYTSTGTLEDQETAHLFAFFDIDEWTNTSLVLIKKDGRVIIGNDIMNNAPQFQPYKLYVQDGILTEKVKVALKDGTSWSDFVFNEDYQLMPLKEVEQFVKTNKHLPDIPSADEVVENGLDLAIMDSKLLQKVEELTLYVIQQQKQIEQQQKEINDLKTKLN